MFNITTVTLNPAIDATIWVDRLDFDEPATCMRRRDYAGGKGVNVSRILSALGVKSRCICLVGEESAGKFGRLLNEDGVAFDFIPEDGTIRENITLTFPEEKMLKINSPGFLVREGKIKTLERLLFDIIGAQGKQLLVFAGSLPRGVTPKRYKELILNCAGRSGSVLTALDNSFFKLPDLKEIKPFIIKPNHVELSHIMGLENPSHDELFDAADELAEFIPHVLLSMGSGGLVYKGGTNSFFVKVPRVSVNSTVGAGDSSLAGFIAALDEGQPIQECVKFAAACGTASVMLDGTQAVSLKQAETMLKRMELPEENNLKK